MGTASSFDLTGRVAVVTGAARGLGAEMALTLGEAGAKIALTDVLEEELQTTAESLRQQGITAIGVPMDVTDEGSVVEALNRIQDSFGLIDVALNNAGIVERGPVEEMTLDAWKRTMEVNVAGVFLVSKHVARRLVSEKSSGSIINVSSMSGFVVNEPMKQAAYNTSKAAVAMLTKSCALEWATYGIRVNAIAPGYMKTLMTGSEFEPGGGYYPLLDRIPMRRLGLPSELGGAVIWLSSNAASYVTGTVLMIDGGYTLP